MALDARNPEVGASGSGECSLPGGVNTSEFSPSRSANQAKSRLKYLAARLHTLGPKPLFHFLDEVERGADLRRHLEEYASLPADFVKAYGGGQFLEPFAIEGGRVP
jgi:hypothetical protein